MTSGFQSLSENRVRLLIHTRSRSGRGLPTLSPIRQLTNTYHHYCSGQSGLSPSAGTNRWALPAAFHTNSSERRITTSYNVGMDVTRRKLGKVLIASAVAAAPAPAAPQAPSDQGSADEVTRSAHEALRANAQQLDKVTLPMATEPACHFKA
jgi:hypothetical protein